MRKIDPELYERLEKLAKALGCELVACEWASQGHHKVFRVYIDAPGGVTIDQCGEVSRQISAMLDVQGIEERYTLEVSSPGINRPLFELAHYQKHLGSQVKIRLYTPIDQRRQYQGTLLRVENDQIFLLIDDLKQEVVLPFSAIEKANLIGDLELPLKKN